MIQRCAATRHFSLHTPSVMENVWIVFFLLPPPTGSIAIDAKFPLEGFRKLTDHDFTKK